MKDNYKFKGWDWTELFPLFDIEESEYKNEEAIGEKMGNIIQGYPYEHSEEETKKFIGHLRAFLRLVADASYSSGPVFEGILAIEDDDSFLSWYAWNLRCMWT